VVANISLQWATMNGAAATIAAVDGNIVTVSGLTTVPLSATGSLTLSGAANAGNNGTFPIVGVDSPTQVRILNAGGVFPDANSGVIAWVLREMPVYPPASHYPSGAHPNYGPEGGLAGSDQALLSDAKALTSHGDHIVGTCAIGTSIATGVVDSNMRVFGVKNLGICSCAVIPTIPDANTTFAAIVMALKKAQIEGAVV
jgi:choline dehydrogenase-like flavoprotein